MAVASKGPLSGPFFFVCSLLRSACAMVLVLSAVQAEAQQRYEIRFESGGGEAQIIGGLVVDGFDQDDGYRLTLSEDLFGDYFLSMRPFRCITHTDRMLCHLPYPYENRRRIGRDGLTDLEYDLLFIARTPAEYGIDPWNGRYFRLRWAGDEILGVLHETDLNVLASPPPEGDLRPLADAEMLPLDAGGSRWAPLLRIVPDR